MIDSGVSFTEVPALTKVEAHQVERRTSSPDDEKTRIKFFQQNPEIRKNVVAEPFANITREKVKEVSGSDNVYTILRSAILSEQDGIYEQAFGKLSANERRQNLYDQIDSSAEMTIRIQKYIEENLSGLDKTSDEDLYKALCQIAFGTADESEIQRKYALSQRRGFRLSIANFLEERNKLSAYSLESLADPKTFAEKYLKQQFTGNIFIEQLPIGLVIYLDEQDYALIEADDKSPKAILSRGVTLSNDWLPTELQGKIILINKGGKENGVKTTEGLSITKGHEIRHILFSKFHAQQNEMLISDTREALSKSQTEQDYRNISGMLFEDFVEKAKDEIIAYFSDGKFDETYSDLRFHQYQWRIEGVEEALSERSDIPEETKKAILETFINDRRKCFEAIRRIRFVAEKMDEQSTNGAIDRDKAEALLRNTPGTKIHRLAKYTDLAIDEIISDRTIKEKDQQAIGGLKNLLTIPEYYDENWWDRASQARDQIKQLLPPAALPTLLNAVSKWSEREWSSFWVEEAILLTKEFVKMHGATETDRGKIKQVMGGVVSQRTGVKDFEDSVKFAKETLDLFK